MLPGCILLAGLTSIARPLEKLATVMVVLYLITGILTLTVNGSAFLKRFELIISNVFTPAGATIMIAFRCGVARGFYSNEAGTGSSPIMFSTAKTDSPIKLSRIIGLP